MTDNQQFFVVMVTFAVFAFCVAFAVFAFCVVKLGEYIYPDED
jgi:hypothetical protein